MRLAFKLDWKGLNLCQMLACCLFAMFLYHEVGALFWSQFPLQCHNVTFQKGTALL
jgi:hypothetical protein